MASLKVISDRCTDNALTVTIRIPPRRNGEPNLACLARVLADAHTVKPDAYDADETPAAVIAHSEGHTADGGGLIAPDIAAAMIRDRVLETDDDVGAPGEPPRCKTGGCDD